MRLLLHVCCGPCTSGALEWLRGEWRGGEITGFFYNPNIYPEGEYLLRREAMEKAGRLLELPVVWSGGESGFGEYARQVPFWQPSPARCKACYTMRLSLAARQAASGNFDAFSTTLLISPYQDLEAIRTVGETLSKTHGPDFIFHDLRPYYRLSRQRARELGLYRQKYCGCAFSELERLSRFQVSGVRGQVLGARCQGSGEPVTS